MRTIIHTVQIHASRADVYHALTTGEGVTGWWTNRAEAEEHEGGLIRFTFHGDFHPEMKQITLDPPARVEWRCVGGHDNWADNTFRFDLRERDGETWLRFTQHYAQELDEDTYGTYNYNWGYYLGSLKRLCETGEGTPFQVPA